MLNRRNVIIGVVIIVGLLIVGSRVMAGSGSEPVDEAVEVQTGVTAQSQEAPKPTDSAPRTPAPSQKPSASSATEARPLEPGQLKTTPGAIVLLNPGTATRGSTIGITGSGFDPGATVDLSVELQAGKLPMDIGFSQVDQGGGFGGVSFSVPEDFNAGSYKVMAKQHDGKKSATAEGNVVAASPAVKLGTQVGKAGDQVTVSGKGFAPREKVKVFFNSLASEPVAQLEADGGGGIGRVSVRVPFGPVGDNSFIFVGETSQAPVTANFLLLTFYPTATISEYAAKADTTLTFSGSGFGPGERVVVYLNGPGGTPLAVVQADEQGAFNNAGSFTIPFQLKSKNMLVFVGERTQTAVTTGFDVLPYTPYAEPSTYGGQPGTAVTFYGQGFARNEVVRVYVGRGQGNPGKHVACFKTDEFGSIIGGSALYTIPGGAQAGKLTFGLVGDKSGAEASATVQVMAATGPTSAAPSPDEQYVCPFDQQGQ
ncbi:MAG: hypothetical protein HY675_05995 [Chloroflexi bacterium]|nr:hypothetical protein [Chloroflexota bacterium]